MRGPTRSVHTPRARSYDVSMLRWIIALALGFAAASVAGCVAGTTEVPATGPLATYRAGGGGMDALLEGTLELQGACIVVAASYGIEVVPVFPAGEATWDGNSLSWRDKVYQPGYSIAVGGGGPNDNTISSEHYIPDDCGSLERWLVAPR